MTWMPLVLSILMKRSKLAPQTQWKWWLVGDKANVWRPHVSWLGLECKWWWENYSCLYHDPESLLPLGLHREVVHSFSGSSLHEFGPSTGILLWNRYCQPKTTCCAIDEQEFGVYYRKFEYITNSELSICLRNKRHQAIVQYRVLSNL